MNGIDRANAQRMLDEIARTSYGSGFFFEGTSGGKGNIGLITGADGQPRVIKYNTHANERGGEATGDQIKSANDLRAQLLSIAAVLNPDVTAQLRAKLGLGANEDASAGQTLLERKITAQAVEIIQKGAMSKAMEGVNAKSLKSVGGTKFEEAKVYTTYGISAKTLKACGEMSTAEFEASVKAAAKKFNLLPAQTPAAGREIASCIAALVKEGKTEQLKEIAKQPATFFDACIKDLQIMQPVREVVTSRLDKLTDFVRANGTEAEKANLKNYKDAIVTAQNVQLLKGKVGAALTGRPASVVQNITNNLMAFFAEINLRQAAKGKPLDSFETLLSRYAGSEEKIRQLDFSLTGDQLKTMPDKIKNWIVGGFTKAVAENKFHNKSNVLVRSLREFGGNVTINGKSPPENPSGEIIADGGKTITFNELKQDGGTGVSGGGTELRIAFHETLIKTFPNPKVRALVSYLISMENGVKGCFTNMFDMPGENNVTGTEIPKFAQFHLQLKGVKGQPTPLDYDVKSKGVYAITIDPDQDGRKGKIKISVSSAEGMAMKGSDMVDLRFDKDDRHKVEVGLARQAYETVVTIDPNVIDENGIPAFTVDKIELK